MHSFTSTVKFNAVICVANEPTVLELKTPPSHKHNKVFRIDLLPAFLLEEQTDGELIVFPASAFAELRFALAQRYQVLPHIKFPTGISVTA